MSIVRVHSLSRESIRQLWIAILISLAFLFVSGLIILLTPFRPDFTIDWSPREPVAWRLLFGDMIVAGAGTILACLSRLAEHACFKEISSSPGAYSGPGGGNGFQMVNTFQLVSFGVLIIGVGLLFRHLYLMLWP